MLPQPFSRDTWLGVLGAISGIGGAVFELVGREES
jgi:hypothetical protein